MPDYDDECECDPCVEERTIARRLDWEVDQYREETRLGL